MGGAFTGLHRHPRKAPGAIESSVKLKIEVASMAKTHYAQDKAIFKSIEAWRAHTCQLNRVMSSMLAHPLELAVGSKSALELQPPC